MTPHLQLTVSKWLSDSESKLLLDPVEEVEGDEAFLDFCCQEEEGGGSKTEACKEDFELFLVILPELVTG